VRACSAHCPLLPARLAPLVTRHSGCGCRFTNQYTAGTYYFDIHPPLGKLVFWFIGWLVGYDNKVVRYAERYAWDV
jgi:hypothetical protein